MKFENKQSVKMDFNNCELRKMEDRIFIVEYDKENNPIGEFDLLEELERSNFLEEVGYKVSISRVINKE